MNKEQEFLEKLSLLKEKALGQESRISQEEVREFFAQDCLAEEQMLLVYDYLLSQRITVTGYMKSGEVMSQNQAGGGSVYTPEEEAYLKEYETDLAALRQEKSGEREQLLKLTAEGAQNQAGGGSVYTPEEEAYLKEYETDLAALRQEKSGEREQLLKLTAEGDVDAKSRLTEIYLPVVLEIAEYETDLAALRQEKSGEREQLLKLTAEGDVDAKSRLTEIYLPVVLEIAKQLWCQDVFLGDLVQEGNVSLMLALDFLKAEGTLEGQAEEIDLCLRREIRLVQEGNVSLMLALDFLKAEGTLEGQAEEIDLCLRREIRQGIQVLIEEQTEMKRCDKKMEEQVNDLDVALHRLADEKGRAVTIDELAEYMKISEEAILDIMKLAGEDLYEKYKDGESEKN